MAGLAVEILSREVRPVAQLVERRSPKPDVGGSIPSWPAKYLASLMDIGSASVSLCLSYMNAYV